MINVTFDLESLGKGYDAAIIQIAAVAFDNNGNEIDNFNRNINLSSVINNNFSIDQSTMDWWRCQGIKVKIDVFDSKSKADIKWALVDFISWLNELNGEYVLWSHSTFDPPKLDYALKVCQIDNTIPYKSFKDIRTLEYLKGKVDKVENDNPHNALSDCYCQAEYICKMLNK